MSKLTKILAGVTLAASLGAWSQAYGDLQYSLVPVGSFTAGTAIQLNLFVGSTVTPASFTDGGGSFSDGTTGTFGAFTVNTDPAFATAIVTLTPPTTGSTFQMKVINSFGVGLDISTPTTQLLGHVMYTSPVAAGTYTVNFTPTHDTNTNSNQIHQVWTENGVEKDDIANFANISSTPAVLTAGVSGLTVNASGTATPPNVLVGTPGTPATISKTGLDAFATTSITINTGAELQLTTNANTRQTAAVVNQLDGSMLTLNGSFDTTNGDLLIHGNGSTTATIQALVTSGKIFSSNVTGNASAFTLAVVSGTDYATATGGALFDSLTVAPTDTVIKYDHLGDINMDGLVNFNDYGILLANYRQPGTKTLIQGDLNGDGVVNFNDYGILLANYRQGTQLAGGDPTLTAGAVPEPASLGLVVLAAAGLLARRKR